MHTVTKEKHELLEELQGPWHRFYNTGHMTRRNTTSFKLLAICNQAQIISMLLILLIDFNQEYIKL